MMFDAGSDHTEADRAAVAGLLRQAIQRDRFPLSPRVRELKAILAKLDPPRPAAPVPYPPSTAWVNSSIGRRKRRR
jgi:hypothetical protein